MQHVAKNTDLNDKPRTSSLDLVVVSKCLSNLSFSDSDEEDAGSSSVSDLAGEDGEESARACFRYRFAPAMGDECHENETVKFIGYNKQGVCLNNMGQEVRLWTIGSSVDCLKYD